MPNQTVRQPLKVALAGAGLISWHHLMAWQKLGDSARVVAVCDPDRSRAEKRAQEFDIPRIHASAEDLFASEEVHAIDVASPRQTHAAWINEAAKRKLGILCQKPLTAYADDRFDQAIEAAKVELDDAKRRQHFHDAQLILHDEGPSVIPAFFNTLDAVSAKIGTPQTTTALANLESRYAFSRWWFN